MAPLSQDFPKFWDLRNSPALELGFCDRLRKGDVAFGDGLPLELSSLRNPATSPTTYLSQDLMVFCRQGSDQLIQLCGRENRRLPEAIGLHLISYLGARLQCLTGTASYLYFTRLL